MQIVHRFPGPPAKTAFAREALATCTDLSGRLAGMDTPIVWFRKTYAFLVCQKQVKSFSVILSIVAQKSKERSKLSEQCRTKKGRFIEKYLVMYYKVYEKAEKNKNQGKSEIMEGK